MFLLFDTSKEKWPFSRRVRSEVLRVDGCFLYFPKNFDRSVESLGGWLGAAPFKSRGKVAADTNPKEILWSIWKERNLLVPLGYKSSLSMAFCTFNHTNTSNISESHHKESFKHPKMFLAKRKNNPFYHSNH